MFSTNKEFSLGKREKPIIDNYRRPVIAKNETQGRYLESIFNKPLTMGIGAAGTGKTYLAAYAAIEHLENRKVDKIVIVRPAVATESLGYLPGDLNEKLDPYLRPLYDCFEERVGIKKLNDYLDSGIIEIAPLAFMRGRTFHNCYIILDEAQNARQDQMKMFLTRFGLYTKCVITGDLEQTDIGSNGLMWAAEQLKNCPSVSIIHFNREDSVRSPLVQELLNYI
jgi:phosphate starvation-inducible PhoH-like protein